jgi:hypothetical protein
MKESVHLLIFRADGPMNRWTDEPIPNETLRAQNHEHHKDAITDQRTHQHDS